MQKYDDGWLIQPGNARHQCEPPTLDLQIRHGAVWRCECGRRWRLWVKQISRSSWEGAWRRWYWPLLR